MKHSGLFITIEGVEGVGKSTVIKHLEQLFLDKQRQVMLTREPGGTEIAEDIRKTLLSHHQEKIVPAAEVMLFFAARAQHVAHLIKPALAVSKVVICDRFTDSSYAYQAAGRAIDDRYLAALEALAHDGLQADLTLLLDASPEVGLARARQIGEPDRMESEKVEFFRKVRAAYLDRAKKFPERFRVVNAEQTLEVVKKEIERVIEEW